MTCNPDKHHRRSIRLKGYDYNQAGAYFVTLLAHQRQPLFGIIQDGAMRLNSWGALADNEWRRLSQRFPYIEVGEFVLMPDHLHGILFITGQDPIRPAHKSGISSIDQPIAPTAGQQQNDAIPALNPASLGAIIGAYKSTTARLINGLRRTPGAPVWQRNYYEHIIRDEAELGRTAEYIRANPSSWEKDQDHPVRIK